MKRRATDSQNLIHVRALGLALVAPTLVFTSCTTVPHVDKQAPPLVQASADLKYARRKTLPVKARAGFYLEAAALADAQLQKNGTDPKALNIYNTAAAELTDILRDADGGQLWNHPLVLTANGTDYQLRFTPKTKRGTWAPDYFTDFKLASAVKSNHLRQQVTVDGIGGTLVGLHKTPTNSSGERVPFEPKRGLVAPVTSTLDFHGREATLSLSDPSAISTVRFHGKPQPLAADFTAPVAFHPPANELWQGLMGLIDVEKYMSRSGLYMINPYDPNRIPVVLVHGLISTPQMWLNVINELESDPLLRGHFQFWVFGYPTGNPPVYSALLCRQELAKMQKLYPMPHGCIMIGHSMGGLVSRMQVTTTNRALWDANFKGKADIFYCKLPSDHLIKQSLIFEANPQVKKVVFVCVPHRGSKLAISSIGAIGQRLIKLPTSVVVTLQQSVIDVLKTANGKVVMPTSITGLSPKSPTLLAMDKLPINAPYYSIIGDRGKGDTPNSSDGVVPYWSSHLASAKSERIVPGPHGSYELPETIDELKRILGDHLNTIK